MALNVRDITVHSEVGQHWALLNPLRLAQVLIANPPEGGVAMVVFKTWSPHEVIEEPWILPLRPDMARHLWVTSLMKLEHFVTPPSEGSVWAKNSSGDLFFVGARSTQYPDKVWVYTDWQHDIGDEPEMAWPSMRQIQNGPQLTEPNNLEQTALEQVLAED
jgi:hypothetical protein